MPFVSPEDMAHLEAFSQTAKNSVREQGKSKAPHA